MGVPPPASSRAVRRERTPQPTYRPINRQRPTMIVTPDGEIIPRPENQRTRSAPELNSQQQTLDIKNVTEEQKQDQCAICLENFENTAAFLPNCRHFFHQTCIERWRSQKNSCPLCTTIITN